MPSHQQCVWVGSLPREQHRGGLRSAGERDHWVLLGPVSEMLTVTGGHVTEAVCVVCGVEGQLLTPSESEADMNETLGRLSCPAQSTWALPSGQSDQDVSVQPGQEGREKGATPALSVPFFP